MSLAAPTEAESRRGSSGGGLGFAASLFGAQMGHEEVDVDSAMAEDNNQRPMTGGASSTISTNAGGSMRHGRVPEIEMAELETRIQRATLQLIQPTIHKTKRMEQDLEDLRDEIRRSSAMNKDIAPVAAKVEEQVVLVESFREEMSKWECERRSVQAHVSESLSVMKTDLDAFRLSLEKKDASLYGANRTMDRIVGELSRLQEGSEALRQHVDLRLGQTGKVLSGAKTDLECKLIGLETKLNRLSDELWGEETGLARAVAKITATNNLAMSLSEEMKRMQHDKANVTQLEAVQEDVNQLICDANTNVTKLQKTVDTMVEDVKAHFNTATNTVAAHNATMLSEVRESYQDELRQAAELRTEVTQFMQETQKSVQRIDHTVDTGQRQTSELVKTVSEDVGELNKSRKRDNSDSTLASQTMKEQLSKVTVSSDTIAKCLEHFGSVVTILLKSERVASALSEQENIDRNKVALMGYRENKPAGARPPSKSARRPSSRQQEAREEGSDGGEAVISVDNRCLSCSGQAQHVLSGFKMACLQYAPGPVTFSKKLYKREELLDLRHRLLEQAQEQLQQGPAGNLTDFTDSKNRSNMQRELEASMKRPGAKEAAPDRPSSQAPQHRPASQNSNGSAMRSQGLPPLSSSPQEMSKPLTAR